MVGVCRYGVVVVVMLVVEVVLKLVGVRKGVMLCYVRVVLFLQLVFLWNVVLLYCYLKICVFVWCGVVFVFVLMGDSGVWILGECVLEVYFYSGSVLGQSVVGGKCVEWEIVSVVGVEKEVVVFLLLEDVLFVLWSYLGFNGGK